MYLEALFVITQSAGQQAQAHYPVEDNHHRGKNSVSRNFIGTFCSCQQNGDNEGDLNHGNRRSEYQGAKRLSQIMCDHLRMVD